MRRRPPRARAALASLLVLGSGCVSVVVDAVPRGAQVYVDGERISTETPCRFKAKTIVGVSYDVVVRKEGYHDFRETVDSEWDPYTLLLVLSPLIVLMPFLGTVTPRHIYATLEPDYSQLPPPVAPGSGPR